MNFEKSEIGFIVIPLIFNPEKLYNRALTQTNSVCFLPLVNFSTKLTSI